MTGGGAIRSTCAYCGVGCGVEVRRAGSRGFAITGDPTHPANRGRLCSKGAALAETLGRTGRLRVPLIGGRPASWTAALDRIAAEFRAAIAEHGPDSVALYLSGQMLTEDYYVANKLMKGFIGSANVDTNSRLCMASSVAGHRRAFGTDTVPGQYRDLEIADLVVLVGSNLAWCHPVLYQRLAAAKAARPGLRVVSIDPRRTATTDLADLHLAIAPGGDAVLFNGLLAEIAARGAVDADYVAAHVGGLEAALAAARSGDLGLAGLPRAEMQAFFDLWIGRDKVVTLFSQGINQSATGTDKVNAIINCHLATGRIGRPGMGPFSVTGQPNAMGGREVGGLANALACHLEIENPAHRAAVQGFWGSPKMATKPGLKAVDMFRALGAGRIKAIWIIHSNPAASLPEADAVRAALAGDAFVAVSDVTGATDTAERADVLLPAAAWGEKEGTVSNSERCISRQRAFMAPPGQARPDWWMICDLARRLGWGAAFDYAGPAAIFREYAALSGVAGGFGVDFDISDLAGISDAEYARLAPFVWPRAGARRGGRFFAAGGFFTPDRRARMVPVTPRSPAAPLHAEYPLRLNTGRVRDHWHTMTRTGLSPRLSQHTAEPFVEIHPADAARFGIAPATIARVESATGAALLRVLVTERVRPGEMFAPIHWSAQTAARARLGALIPAITDPISGQPESKAAAARVRPFAARWFGFAVSRGRPRAETAYWACARSRHGWRMELADDASPEDWEGFARGLFDLPRALAVTMIDRTGGRARIALMERGRVVAVFFAAPEPVAVARAHVAREIGQSAAAAILAGRPAAEAEDPGAAVCACFDVGINTILAAIVEQKLTSVEAIGRALRAGTNCGSCRPELKALLATRALAEAAE